ncbi:MAG: M1 family metallopeptidase [Bacteroidetes bacterium]|nr:M1 family metallopeptidase [Bacteroidota bacterium]
MKTQFKFLVIILLSAVFSYAQENTNTNKFRQLYDQLPTPNAYRSADGQPGPWYYQNTADYKMNLELDDAKQILKGSETITYTNNSKDELSYIWLQLDQNMRSKDSDTRKISTQQLSKKTAFRAIERDFYFEEYDGGFKIEEVKDASGKDLPNTVVNTMMRVDLPKTLKPGDKFSFSVKWWYNINDRMKVGGRGGYEYFKEENNYIYTMAQFFPRMCVYNEVEGWQNKQFLGRGEFTLPFGNYEVSIKVPSDHLVAGTGELQNASNVLSSEQRERFNKAKNATDKPVLIVTQEEAEENEKEKATGTKTWTYKATQVRDFAFASSRKFMWDGMAAEVGVGSNKKKILCMSFYPKEGNPLWEKYSTELVAHTIKTYSKFTIDYPYPVAQSIHSNRIGMEYPMICFNGGRPQKDGTYSEGTKYGMHGVIIHEVGHNFFPMIINSDERQWTWMDEGLNTFVQYLTEQEWSDHYPSRRGPADKITSYMKGDKSKISPIMTNSESIYQFGNNSYAKPATALNILRETVLGRELFDYAFKTYCERWAFKHPYPADFFRTMEDASGVDLDWFWRGWFYTNDHCDQSIEDIVWYKIDSKDPDVEKALSKKEDEAKRMFIGDIRNDTALTPLMNQKPELAEFYDDIDRKYEVNRLDREDYESYLKGITEHQKEILNSGLNFYQLKFKNHGGLVMPVILRFTFTDGTTEVIRIPVEIWKMNDKEVTKVFYFEKEVNRIELDPFLEIADTDKYNNYWPREVIPTRFELYKGSSSRYRGSGGENPMQREKRANEPVKEK